MYFYDQEICHHGKTILNNFHCFREIILSPWKDNTYQYSLFQRNYPNICYRVMVLHVITTITCSFKRFENQTFQFFHECFCILIEVSARNMGIVFMYYVFVIYYDI